MDDDRLNRPQYSEEMGVIQPKSEYIWDEQIEGKPMNVEPSPPGSKLRITIEIITGEGECWYQIKHHPLIWESAQVEGSGTRDHIRGTIRALVRVLVDRWLDTGKE